MYPLPSSGTSASPTDFATPVAANLAAKVSDFLWHDRLGHPSNAVLNILHQSSCISLHKADFSRVCKHCLSAKMTKLPFSASVSCTSTPLDIVHSDLWGPSPVASYHGFRYYVSLVDDFSRYNWFFPL